MEREANLRPRQRAVQRHWREDQKRDGYLPNASKSRWCLCLAALVMGNPTELALASSYAWIQTFSRSPQRAWYEMPPPRDFSLLPKEGREVAAATAVYSASEFPRKA
jgi:hypothetical protein